VHMRGVPGTSLPQAMAVGRRVTEELRRNPAVVSVAQQAGRAELGEDTWGVEYSELEVELQRVGAADAVRVQRELREALTENTPGFFFRVMPFLTERIRETVSGEPVAVAVKVYGDDLDKVELAAQLIVRALGQVKGNQDLHAEPQTGAPELVVRVRREDAN